MKCPSLDEAIRWKFAIEDMVRSSGADFNRRHVYDSYFPRRAKTYGEWSSPPGEDSFSFVDGRSFFSRVADIIKIAKEEIFVAGEGEIFGLRQAGGCPRSST